MTTASKYALGSVGFGVLVGGAAYGVSYARARRRFPTLKNDPGVTMNKPPQAHYEGATWALTFGGAALVLGGAFLHSLGY